VLRKLGGRQLPEAFLPQSGHEGLGIPKARTLLQNLPSPPAASVLHFSKPGILDDFMLDINPNPGKTGYPHAKE